MVARPLVRDNEIELQHPDAVAQSHYLKTVPRGLCWIGAHPHVPHAVYQVLVKRKFQKLFQDANLELEVKVKTPSEVRILYRDQGDFSTPFLKLAEIERLLGGRLIEFLLEQPDPRKTSGMYSLLYEAGRSDCPWAEEISNYRLELSINWNAVDFDSTGSD